jgi:hypothetical protein
MSINKEMSRVNHGHVVNDNVKSGMVIRGSCKIGPERREAGSTDHQLNDRLR